MIRIRYSLCIAKSDRDKNSSWILHSKLREGGGEGGGRGGRGGGGGEGGGTVVKNYCYYCIIHYIHNKHLIKKEAILLIHILSKD